LDFDHIAGASQTARGSNLTFREKPRQYQVILSFDSLYADFALAWRRLRKSKVTSAAAILSLALGIGACLAAFQLVNALVLRPLPIAGPDRLYALFRQEFRADGPPTTRDTWQAPLLQNMGDAVAQEAALLEISEAERVEITFRSDQEMERAQVQYVSGNTFESFGLRAAAGRLQSQRDDLKPGAHPVAILSHDYWARRFAQDPAVIGRTFRMTNNLTGPRIYQIVGVLEAGFTGTEPGKVVDVFLPAMMHWGIAFPQWSLFRGFVHVRSNASVSVTRDHLRATLSAFNETKANHPLQELEMKPAGAGVSPMQKDYGVSLAGLSALVALVLLIACVNVANLMLAQTAARSREMALRISIGAPAGRLSQLMLVEAAIIGLLASALGWCFARWAGPFVLARVNPPDNPVVLSLSIDWRVLAFAFLLAFCVTLLFGAAPACHASATQPIETLKGGGDPHSRGRWMRALIALQSAFCFFVLFVAGLFVATSDHLQEQANRFSSLRILNIDVVNPANEPSVLWDQVADHLRAKNGVQAVAYADWPILDGRSFKTDAISIGGAPPSETSVWFTNVSPGWLAMMEIPLLAGRDFNSADLSPGVAVINEAFSREFFGSENPLGKWFSGTTGWMRGQKFQIIGLVRNARYRDLRQPVLPVAYTPFRRTGTGGTMQGGTFVVRTTVSNPLTLASLLRNEIPRGRPEFRVSNMRTPRQLIDSQTVRERLLAMLARFFGAIATLLVSVGMYGALDYSVFQRRREIGIRMAVGAQPKVLAVHVTARFFWMLLLGTVTGCVLSLASVRYIEPLLYQVRPTALPGLLVPALAMMGAAIIAALPAVNHAVKIDVARLLRADQKR
jgi:predicted permease